MNYNSTREKLVMKEYGRHVQSIVENCMKVEDPEKRQAFAKEIIELMGQLNPHLKNVDDFKHKLWDHLFIMSDFKLEVDSPYPKTTAAEIAKRPEPLPYPKGKIKYKHYGKNVETLVEKALTTEDKEKQMGFAQCIGNYMKLVYENWNKEQVTPELIKNDLRILSHGTLNLSVDLDINSLSRSNRNKPKQAMKSNNNRGGNNAGRSSGNGSNNNRPNNNRKPHDKNRNPKNPL